MIVVYSIYYGLNSKYTDYNYILIYKHRLLIDDYNTIKCSKNDYLFVTDFMFLATCGIFCCIGTN